MTLAEMKLTVDAMAADAHKAGVNTHSVDVMTVQFSEKEIQSEFELTIHEDGTWGFVEVWFAK